LNEYVVFIVTGGGCGIGKALAVALAARGQSVLIIGRAEHALIETAATSSLIRYVCADVSEAKGRDIIENALKDTAVISGLIHNAGIIEPILPITEIDESSWQKHMATNLDAPLFLTQLLADKLKNGRVLNIGSGAAFFPVAGWTAYCVSKAALLMLTRCWQLERKAIEFAYVMPGIIDTQMQTTIRNAQHMQVEKQDFFKELKQRDRLISPQTVAAFLCWLLLDIDSSLYSSKEWDIYDTSHHNAWLVAPLTVPTLE
jgi:benzil reductase ((S)-benzoin forming)